MLSLLLPAGLVLLAVVGPIVLRWLAGDDPDNTVHHHDDPPDTAGVTAAAV